MLKNYKEMSISCSHARFECITINLFYTTLKIVHKMLQQYQGEQVSKSMV